MLATARWLTRFVRETCARPEGPIRYLEGAYDDASTLRSVIDLTTSLATVAPEAAAGRAFAEQLLAACDRQGRLPEGARSSVQTLVGMLESRLA